jgi:hypothetical protein
VKSAGNPWMKFYPADWRADPALRSCTIGARGLWVEMLCIMHEATPYGSLVINGARVDKKRIAALSGIPERECIVLLLELEGFGVFSRDDDGTIYSRRMRRDAFKAAKDKENGKGGGNPRLKAGVNPPDKPEVKAQKPEARDQSQKDSEPDGSDAGASIDHRKRLFDEGIPAVRRMTGKGPDACRSFLGKCLKAAEDNAITVLGLIEDAERNEVIDPCAWIVARLKPAENFNGKAKSGIIQAADDLRRKAASFDGPANPIDELRDGARTIATRLLSHG